MSEDTAVPPPAPSPRHQNTPTPTQVPANTGGGKHLVKTTWKCSEFRVGGNVITPEGVELDTASKDAAVKAAKKSRVALKVEEVSS